MGIPGPHPTSESAPYAIRTPCRPPAPGPWTPPLPWTHRARPPELGKPRGRGFPQRPPPASSSSSRSTRQDRCPSQAHRRVSRICHYLAIVDTWRCYGDSSAHAAESPGVAGGPWRRTVAREPAARRLFPALSRRNRRPCARCAALGPPPPVATPASEPVQEAPVRHPRRRAPATRSPHIDLYDIQQPVVKSRRCIRPAPHAGCQGFDSHAPAKRCTSSCAPQMDEDVRESTTVATPCEQCPVALSRWSCRAVEAVTESEECGRVSPEGAERGEAGVVPSTGGASRGTDR